MFSLQEHCHDQAEVLLTFVGPPNLLQRCDWGRVGMLVSSGNIGNRGMSKDPTMSRHCGGGSSWIFHGGHGGHDAVMVWVQQRMPTLEDLSGRTESQRHFALLQHVTMAVHRCQGWMDQL